MQVDFYHLTQSPIERVLPRICERVVEEGGRLLIVAEEPLLGQLDSLLWSYAPTSFLPHGRADAPRQEAQPILLSTAPTPTNGADRIALADGRWRDESLEFARCFYFFDADHLAEARTSWRALKGREGVETRYWKQGETGQWVQGP